MTVAVLLLAYAAGFGIIGAGRLAQAGWTARAPLLAIVTYLAAVWSVVAALGLAGLTLAVHASALGSVFSQLIGACVLRLRATYASPGGTAMAGAGLVLSGVVVAHTAFTAVGHLRASRRQALRHAHSARLVGRPDPALGVVLLEHAQPTAYCVAGRHPTVILTTGALLALDADQLDAVVAHERAHLAWRHHLLLAMARIGRRVLPFLPLMREVEVQVERLVELHADDTAKRARDPESLASALVVLAAANSAPGPAPGAHSASVLAATATDAVQRIHRLLRPAEPLGGLRRLLLRAMPIALVLLPVVLALAPAMLALALGRVPHA